MRPPAPHPAALPFCPGARTAEPAATARLRQPELLLRPKRAPVELDGFSRICHTDVSKQLVNMHCILPVRYRTRPHGSAGAIAASWRNLTSPAQRDSTAT